MARESGVVHAVVPEPSGVLRGETAGHDGVVLPVDDAGDDAGVLVEEDVGLGKVLVHQGTAERAFRQRGDERRGVLLELGEQFLRVARFHGERGVVRDFEEVPHVVFQSVVNLVGQPRWWCADTRHDDERVFVAPSR